MSIFTSFRAGSGNYQNVVPILIQNSFTVNASAAVLEGFSNGNLTNGSLTNMAADSLFFANWANPGAVSTSAYNGNISGVVIQDAWLSTNTSGATGGNNNLYLWVQNMTATNATIASGTQINLIQF